MTTKIRIILAFAALAWPAAASAQWSEAPPLEEPIHGAAAAALDGSVFIGGGAGLLAPRDTFSVLQPGGTEWTPLESLPAGLVGHAMAALDGVIYVAGGEQGRPPEAAGQGDRNRVQIGLPKGPEGPSARVWTYDPATETWGEAPPMPTVRSEFALTVLDGRLYASGGGRLIAFDPESAAWMDLGPEPTGAGRAAAAVNGKLYLIGGGATGEHGAGARVDIYDPAAETWSRGPDLPFPRVGHAAAAAEGQVHVMGGRDAEGETVADHLVLDGGSWLPAIPLQSPRAGAAAAVLADGRIVLAGGFNAGGFFAAFTAVDLVDIYDTPRQ